MGKSKCILGSLVLLILGMIIGMCVCLTVYRSGVIVASTDVRKEEYVEIELNGKVGEELAQIKVKDGEKLIIRGGLQKGIAEIEIENNKTKIQKKLRQGGKNEFYEYNVPEGSYKVSIKCKSSNILEKILQVGVVGKIELEAVEVEGQKDV